jgi:hypothetical protein
VVRDVACDFRKRSIHFRPFLKGHCQSNVNQSTTLMDSLAVDQARQEVARLLKTFGCPELIWLNAGSLVRR